MSLQTSLSRHQPQEPAEEPHIAAMRRAAWLKQGVAVLRPDELNDDLERQLVVNIAERLYGRRRDG